MLKRGDVAGALAVLQAVVAHTPNDLVQRRALREIEKRIRTETKVDEQSASLVLMDVSWEIQQAKHKREDKFIEWDTIDRAAERGLAVDPCDVELHLELGIACQARGYREVALFAFRCALEVAPNRADIKERLARLPE